MFTFDDKPEVLDEIKGRLIREIRNKRTQLPPGAWRDVVEELNIIRDHYGGKLRMIQELNIAHNEVHNWLIEKYGEHLYGDTYNVSDFGAMLVEADTVFYTNLTNYVNRKRLFGSVRLAKFAFRVASWVATFAGVPLIGWL